MMDIETLGRLRAIGLTPALLQPALALLAREPDARLMRVAEVQREGLCLHDGQFEHAARLLPAVRDERVAVSDAVAVGDWVLASRYRFGK